MSIELLQSGDIVSVVTGVEFIFGVCVGLTFEEASRAIVSTYLDEDNALIGPYDPADEQRSTEDRRAQLQADIDAALGRTTNTTYDDDPDVVTDSA